MSRTVILGRLGVTKLTSNATLQKVLFNVSVLLLPSTNKNHRSIESP